MCKTMKELEEQVKTYRSLKALLDEANEEMEACKAEILNYLQTNGKEKEIGLDFTVSYSNCSRTVYDGDALKELLGDEISSFQKVSQYTRVNVR